VRAVRNVTAVVLVFVLVATSILLVRFLPPRRLLFGDMPEIDRQRFSRTENAWYVLDEADNLMPPRPTKAKNPTNPG